MRAGVEAIVTPHPSRVGVRARLHASLFLVVVTVLPVVAASLIQFQRLGAGIEDLEAEAATVHTEVGSLADAIRGGEGGAALGRRLSDLDGHLASMDAARAMVRRRLAQAQRDVLTALLVTAALATFLVVALPRRVLRPMRRILNALRRASAGDYAARTGMEGRDEVGAVASEINRLLARVQEDRARADVLLREVRRDMDLFGREVDEAVCLVDSELRILWANDAFLALVGVGDDPVGTDIDRWVGGPSFLEAAARAFSGGTRDAEVVLEVGDHRVQAHLRTAAGRDPAGGVDRVALVLTATRPTPEG